MDFLPRWSWNDFILKLKDEGLPVKAFSAEAGASLVGESMDSNSLLSDIDPRLQVRVL